MVDLLQEPEIGWEEDVRVTLPSKIQTSDADTSLMQVKTTEQSWSICSRREKAVGK